MLKDCYEVLEVERTADRATIRKAYAALARRLHPDLNPSDATAEAAFKEVSAAYEILGDTEKRRIYDLYGHQGLKRGFVPPGTSDQTTNDFWREYQEQWRQSYSRRSGVKETGINLYGRATFTDEDIETKIRNLKETLDQQLRKKQFTSLDPIVSELMGIHVAFQHARAGYRNSPFERLVNSLPEYCHERIFGRYDESSSRFIGGIELWEELIEARVTTQELTSLESLCQTLGRDVGKTKTDLFTNAMDVYVDGVLRNSTSDIPGRGFRIINWSRSIRSRVEDHLDHYHVVRERMIHALDINPTGLEENLAARYFKTFMEFGGLDGSTFATPHYSTSSLTGRKIVTHSRGPILEADAVYGDGFLVVTAITLLQQRECKEDLVLASRPPVCSGNLLTRQLVKHEEALTHKMKSKMPAKNSPTAGMEKDDIYDCTDALTRMAYIAGTPEAKQTAHRIAQSVGIRHIGLFGKIMYHYSNQGFDPNRTFKDPFF